MRNYLARHRLRGPGPYRTFAEPCGRQCNFIRNLFGDQILHLVIWTGECEAMNFKARIWLAETLLFLMSQKKELSLTFRSDCISRGSI